MSVKYKLVQEKRSDSKYNGQWYARATVTDVVSLNELAEDIQRYTTVTRSDVLAVLASLTEVMREELLDGNRVVLDGIGSFKVGLSSKPAPTAQEWTPTKHLAGTHIVFRPETLDTISNGKRTRSAKILQGVKVEELRKYDTGDGAADEGA